MVALIQVYVATICASMVCHSDAFVTRWIDKHAISAPNPLLCRSSVAAILLYVSRIARASIRYVDAFTTVKAHEAKRRALCLCHSIKSRHNEAEDHLQATHRHKRSEAQHVRANGTEEAVPPHPIDSQALLHAHHHAPQALPQSLIALRRESQQQSKAAPRRAGPYEVGVAGSRGIGRGVAKDSFAPRKPASPPPDRCE